MQRIEVDAYDGRHPEHESMMALVDDKGLDIELLPTFKVEISVPETGANQPRAGVVDERGWRRAWPAREISALPGATVPAAAKRDETP